MKHEFQKVPGGYVIDIITKEKYMLIDKNTNLTMQVNLLKKRVLYLEGIQRRLGVEFGVENYKGENNNGETERISE